MNEAVKAWLLSQLGTTTDVTDLQIRYTRLGTSRAVALEVLGERLAAAIERPSTIGVSGVTNLGFGPNIQALERLIARLRAGDPPAPDDPAPTPDSTGDGFGIIQLVERPRR
ncbi:hypothetical protein [[Kitasatospora] papulosa]|uniref:hypothetical protein n=1 Tax=[Kitasatospora] papulosa TaxID=1464011 RepID=UPI0036B46BEA